MRILSLHFFFHIIVRIACTAVNNNNIMTFNIKQTLVFIYIITSTLLLMNFLDDRPSIRNNKSCMAVQSNLHNNLMLLQFWIRKALRKIIRKFKSVYMLGERRNACSNNYTIIIVIIQWAQMKRPVSGWNKRGPKALVDSERKWAWVRD